MGKHIKISAEAIAEASKDLQSGCGTMAEKRLHFVLEVAAELFEDVKRLLAEKEELIDTLITAAGDSEKARQLLVNILMLRDLRYSEAREIGPLPETFARYILLMDDRPEPDKVFESDLERIEEMVHGFRFESRNAPPFDDEDSGPVGSEKQ